MLPVLWHLSTTAMFLFELSSLQQLHPSAVHQRTSVFPTVSFSFLTLAQLLSSFLACSISVICSLVITSRYTSHISNRSLCLFTCLVTNNFLRVYLISIRNFRTFLCARSSSLRPYLSLQLDDTRCYCRATCRQFCHGHCFWGYMIQISAPIPSGLLVLLNLFSGTKTKVKWMIFVALATCWVAFLVINL